VGHLRRGADPRQRIPQTVGHRGGELTDRREGLLAHEIVLGRPPGIERQRVPEREAEEQRQQEMDRIPDA
jgi:hypothetical protein